jgi:hypothetical protein
VAAESPVSDLAAGTARFFLLSVHSTSLALSAVRPIPYSIAPVNHVTNITVYSMTMSMSQACEDLLAEDGLMDSHIT